MRGRRSKLSTAKARPGCAHLPPRACRPFPLDRRPWRWHGPCFGAVPSLGVILPGLSPAAQKGWRGFFDSADRGQRRSVQRHREGARIHRQSRLNSSIASFGTGQVPASTASGPVAPGPRPATGSRTGLRCARLNAKQPRPARQMRAARYGPGLAGAPAGASTKTGFAVARRISGMEDKALKPSWSTLSQFPSAY